VACNLNCEASETPSCSGNGEFPRKREEDCDDGAEAAMTMPHQIPDDAVSGSVVFPAIELRGSDADKLRTLDASIARLQQVRRTIAGDAAAYGPPSELHGPYLHAPVWPWFLAGWIIGALFVLMFVFARLWA
jgi:hypothetical protein